MKKGFLLVLMCLLSVSLIAGCSIKNPFADNTKPAEETNNQKEVTKQEPKNNVEEKVDVDQVVVKMVNEIRAGYFDKAIVLGKEAYEEGKSSEKFLDTLAVAYGYKNSLEELTKKEEEEYLTTVRQLLTKDPTNFYKKNLLASVLIDTGNITEGNRIASEAYVNAGETKPKEVIDTYGWGLYKAGRVNEAVPLFNTLNSMGTDNLTQTYHTAVVLENADKAKSLSLYKRIISWANNAVTWEENRDNLAATAHINKIKKNAQDAINRIQLKATS